MTPPCYTHKLGDSAGWIPSTLQFDRDAHHTEACDLGESQEEIKATRHQSIRDSLERIRLHCESLDEQRNYYVQKLKITHAQARLLKIQERRARKLRAEVQGVFREVMQALKRHERHRSAADARHAQLLDLMHQEGVGQGNAPMDFDSGIVFSDISDSEESYSSHPGTPEDS